MKGAPVFVLGGAQTDFARHWTREGKTVVDLMRETARATLDAVGVRAADVESMHVGNFTSELFTGQGHLGGFASSLDPGFDGIATSTHEAACASGGAAALAAIAEIQAGWYDLVLVLGVEFMRNVPGEVASKYVGAASHVGVEAAGAKHAWPRLFGDLFEAYDARHGVDRAHLAALARSDFDNAKTNPNAQTRKWVLGDDHFRANDELNPLVDGPLRRHDCSQVTDGGAGVLFASTRFAEAWAEKMGTPLDTIPRVLGFGHRTAPMTLEAKLAASAGAAWTFPHLRGAIEDTWRRAEIDGPGAIDALEIHDCFTITGYAILDHLGLAPHGKLGALVDRGAFRRGSQLPVNPSGGLIGVGHPVGATGVRMLVDAHAQVTGTAGEAQVANAKRVQCINVGGSFTTVVSTLVGI